MKIKVRVPATTANLGPGFDSLGLALKLYNFVEAEETGGALEIDIKGEGRSSLPRDETNLVYKMIALVFRRAGKKIKGLGIKQINNIPTARGLGSSAAAVAAGLAAGNYLSKAGLTKHEILDIAAEQEGHPDNVVPALFGGLTISAVEGGNVRFMKFAPPAGMGVLLAVPGFELATAEARKVLPAEISRADAVFNINRTAFLTASLLKGNFENLGFAMQDKIHQPYRQRLVPGLSEILKIREKNLGIALSGAGPSIAVFGGGGFGKVKSRIRNILQKHDVKVVFKSVKPEKDGLRLF